MKLLWRLTDFYFVHLFHDIYAIESVLSPLVEYFYLLAKKLVDHEYIELQQPKFHQKALMFSDGYNVNKHPEEMV